MTGIIVSVPPAVEAPPGSNTNNPATLPGITYLYAVLNNIQIWTALQSFQRNTFGLLGSTSGKLLLNSSAIASGVITFPSGTTDFSLSGGASQVVKQTTAGGPFTVGTIAPSDISTTTQTIVAGATVTVQNSDALIVLNKGVGSATAVTLPLSTSKSGGVLIVDFKGDSDANPITVSASGSDKFPGNLSSWTVSSQGAAVLFTPISGLGYAVQ